MTKLYAAIDIIDDIRTCGFFPDKQHLAVLMKYLRKLNVRRLEWITNDWMDIHVDYPHGFDLESEAIQAAHREGIEFHAVYKTFEGALHSRVLPHEAPCPAGTPVWRDERGVLPGVESFIAENPELCMEIRPDLPRPSGALTTLRVALSPDSPVPAINSHAFSLWTGRANGQFECYTQPFSVSMIDGNARTSGKIPSGPLLIINGLSIGPETPYLELRNEKAGPLLLQNRPGGKTLECLNHRGELLPNTPATPSASSFASSSFTQINFSWLDSIGLQIIPWGKTSEAKNFLADKQKLNPLLGKTRAYDSFWEVEGKCTEFPQGASIGAFRGKPRYLPGILNPVYPAVRRHWLTRIEQLINQGVDGVNIRPTSHYHPTDYRDYGFNPPVLEACHGKVNWPGAAACISDAFTQFLREARELLHTHGKKLGVHIMNSDYFERLPDTAVWTNVPPGIGRDWQTWVDKIADYAEYRVGVGNNPEAMAATIDPVVEICRKSHIPLIYQGNPGLLRPSTMFRDPESTANNRARLDNLAGEIDLVRSRSGIAAYLLYEVHSFTILERNNSIRGCEDVEGVLRISGLSDQEQASP